MLSLTGGWQLEEVEKWPARKVQRYRRFFRRCPFGPVRQDIAAWLLAQNVGPGFFGKLRPLQECVFRPRRRKRLKKPKPQGVSGERMKAWVRAMGGTVKEPDDGGT